MSRPTIEVYTVKSQVRVRRITRLRWAWHRFRIGKRGRLLEDQYQREMEKAFLFGSRYGHTPENGR